MRLLAALFLLSASHSASSSTPHIPSIDSAYEAERLMAIRFTDTNTAWLVPKGTGAVVLLTPPGTPEAAKSHFLSFTHAFRLATFDRDKRVPTGFLDTARYPAAVRHLLGDAYTLSTTPTAVLVKNRKILAKISFQPDPKAAARSLAQIVAKKLSTSADVAPTPLERLAGAHVELMSRVFHKNASVALLYGKWEENEENGKKRAQEECKAQQHPRLPPYVPAIRTEPCVCVCVWEGIEPGSLQSIDRVEIEALSRKDFLCKYAFPGP